MNDINPKVSFKPNEKVYNHDLDFKQEQIVHDIRSRLDLLELI